jgi:hypothetical protein
MARIDEHIGSPDRHQRILAANLVTLVRRSCQVAPNFLNLGQDHDPAVRVEIANLLKVSNFDRIVFESILTVLSEDPSDDVRIAAALVYGDVAPHYYEPYLKLLVDRITMEAALSGFVSVAQYSGFAPLATAFCTATELFPKHCANILLAFAPLADPRDLEFVFRTSWLLRHCSTFVKHLFEFSQCFDSKRRVLSFFKLKRVRSDKERLQDAHQCALFVPDLGAELLGVALTFAQNESPDVQAAALPILTAICRNDPAVIEQIKRLARLEESDEMLPGLTEPPWIHDRLAEGLRYALEPLRSRTLAV